MIPTLLSRVPRGSQGPGLFTHCEPANYSLGVLTERMCDPRPGVWELCESHPISMGQDHVYEETPTYKAKKKGMNTCEFHLCLGINAL